MIDDVIMKVSALVFGIGIVLGIAFVLFGGNALGLDFSSNVSGCAF